VFVGVCDGTEHVHSQGIVLEDRSVLYKYLNPNLVAVLTEGQDNQHKGIIIILIIIIIILSSLIYLNLQLSCSGKLCNHGRRTAQHFVH